MKKFFSLITAMLVAVAVFAASPRVTVYSSNQDFDITIDGKSYSSRETIHLDNIRNGEHTIQVFRRGSGIFRSKQLVSSQRFTVQDNHVRIMVDRDGSISVKSDRLRNGDRNDRRDIDRDRRYGDDKDRRYGDNHERGYSKKGKRHDRGWHKGHHKDKKYGKKQKRDRDEDDDDDDDDDDEDDD